MEKKMVVYVTDKKDGLQVEDENAIDNNKHNIEYVLDYYTRFRISRVLQTA